MKNLIYLRDVVTLKLDSNRCAGCGMCLEVCPHGVFEMDGRRARIKVRDACIECGACSQNCPAGAISVDRGVGCATAVINSMLNRKDTACCCGGGDGSTPFGKNKVTCC